MILAVDFVRQPLDVLSFHYAHERKTCATNKPKPDLIKKNNENRLT